MVSPMISGRSVECQQTSHNTRLHKTKMHVGPIQPYLSHRSTPAVPVMFTCAPLCKNRMLKEHNKKKFNLKLSKYTYIWHKLLICAPIPLNKSTST